MEAEDEISAYVNFIHDICRVDYALHCSIGIWLEIPILYVCNDILYTMIAIYS